MTSNTDSTSRKPLRLWPGVALAIVLVLARFVVPLAAPDAAVAELPIPVLGVLGGIACALAIVVWWLFFSRVAWAERIGVFVLMVVALGATYLIIHPSIAGGAMGMMFPIYSIPVVAAALVAGVAAGRRLAAGPRRAVIAPSVLLACAAFTLIRTGGMGDG